MSTFQFDREKMQRFYGDASEEEIINFLGEYISSQQSVLASLKSAYQVSRQALSESVHFHSSIFSYVGFPQLTQECIMLEQMCQTESNDNILGQHYNQLISKIAQTGEIIAAEVTRLKAICSSKAGVC